MAVTDENAGDFGEYAHWALMWAVLCMAVVTILLAALVTMAFVTGVL